MLNAEETSIRQNLAEISFHTALFVFSPLLFLKLVGLLLRILLSHMYTLVSLKMNTQFQGKMKMQEDGTLPRSGPKVNISAFH